MTEPIDELSTPYDDELRTDPDIDPPNDDEFGEAEVELLEDPDPATARELDHTADALVTDELLSEDEVFESDPPDEPSTPTELGVTGVSDHETIEDRLAQEEPDVQI